MFVLHEAIQFFIQAIKPVQDPVNVSVDFLFGNVLFSDFLAGTVKEDLDALEFI
jgi:hypothetical protein